MIGITFAVTYIAIGGKNWLQHPILIPVIIYGFITVLTPFFIMQPLLGLGFAASKTSNPAQERFRSLRNHTAFGAGLYLFALLVNWLLLVYA